MLAARASNCSFRICLPGLTVRTVPAIIRRDNLKRLLEDRFKGRIAELGRALGQDDAYVWQLLNSKRNIGERVARKIEAKLDLAPGALDSATMSGQAALTSDELQLVEHYRQASSTWKLVLRILAKQRAGPQEDMSSDIRALLAKVAASHLNDDDREAPSGGPQAVREATPPPYRKK